MKAAVNADLTTALRTCWSWACLLEGEIAKMRLSHEPQSVTGMLKKQEIWTADRLFFRSPEKFKAFVGMFALGPGA